MLLVANALFYLNMDVAIVKVIGVIFLYAIVLWLAMQMYMMPLLVEQEDKRVRLVLRNAFFLTMAHIIPTLVIFVVLTVLVLVSVAITLLVALLTASVVALVMARALQILLERYRPTAAARD